MKELYIILAKIGWIWFGLFIPLLALGLAIRRRLDRRKHSGQGVVANNEKQS